MIVSHQGNNVFVSNVKTYQQTISLTAIKLLNHSYLKTCITAGLVFLC